MSKYHVYGYTIDKLTGEKKIVVKNEFDSLRQAKIYVKKMMSHKRIDGHKLVLVINSEQDKEELIPLLEWIAYFNEKISKFNKDMPEYYKYLELKRKLIKQIEQIIQELDIKK